MKVLISAYACETGRGGEGEISWRLVHRLASYHDVYVITRANLRATHQAAFLVSPKPERLHFIYFDLPWIFRFYKRKKRLFLVYYYLWQLGVGIIARKIVKEREIDILHHLIGGMDWMPAGLSLAPGPLIWGPVGSENTHSLMKSKLPLPSRIKDNCRSFARCLMRTLDPLVRLSAMRASVILSHTPETMPKRYHPKLVPFVQTGIENTSYLAHAKTDLTRLSCLRLIFAGELKDWKGASLALDSALRFFEQEDEATLVIIGDGPLRASMEAKAYSHKHGNRVKFLGKVPMETLVKELHMADVFLYPSFHHGMATVVLQAMLTGLPIVCIEGDAIGRAIGQTGGITVQLAKDRDPVDDLAGALLHLASNETLRQSLASTAREMAHQNFSYDHQALALAKIYEKVADKFENLGSL
ncbi:MAG: glycosyltransferase family 4 protein [Porticoccaceae bacterium]|nr:glycosyltransferase family 4 protein [Porticoccaceae bacterium]